jgi:hypothetical protein
VALNGRAWLTFLGAGRRLIRLALSGAFLLAIKGRSCVARNSLKVDLRLSTLAIDKRRMARR